MISTHIENKFVRKERAIMRGIKAKIIINDESVDAAIDIWFGYKFWRENSDAENVRRLMRRTIEAAIAAAPLRMSSKP